MVRKPLYLLSLVWLCPYALGDTLLVPAEFSTMQAAIAAASDGDEIQVSPGVYAEHLDTLGKAIRIRSTGGPESTTIDAGSSGSAILCRTGEGPQTIIEGFTITGGLGTLIGPSTFGGAIVCEGAGPTIRDCVLSGNSAGFGGAVALVAGSTPVIESCSLVSNVAGLGGGGIYIEAGSLLTIRDSLFDNSISAASGGGILNDGGSLVVDRCNFLNGFAGFLSFGGGIANFNSSRATITESMFDGNFGVKGSAIANVDSDDVWIERCKFMDNLSDGGTVLNERSDNTVVLCLFERNESGAGGALRNREGSPLIERCRFVDNVSQNANGGFLDGGASLDDRGASPTYLRCHFQANRGSHGGAIGTGFVSDASVIECRFIGNRGNSRGGGVYLDRGQLLIERCIFVSNMSNSQGSAIFGSQNQIDLRDSIFLNNFPSGFDDLGGNEFHFDARPCSPADLTTSQDPDDPGYGVPDLRVSSDDFFFFLELFAAGSWRADLTGASDPTDFAYDLPDGSVDAQDFFRYLEIFAEGCDLKASTNR